MKITWTYTKIYMELINIYVQKPEENTEHYINIFTTYFPFKFVKIMNLENL